MPISSLSRSPLDAKSTMRAAVGETDPKNMRFSRTTGNLIINEFVDLTDDDYICYMCEQIINEPTHCLTTSMTLRSNVSIAQKLGQALGKRYVVVISDDDYICDECKTLLDKLDGPVKEAKRFKTILRKLIEFTYCFSKNTINIMPSQDYKKFQTMFDHQDFENDEPPRKRSRMNNSTVSRRFSVKTEPCEEIANKDVNCNKRVFCQDLDLLALGHEYCFHCNEQNAGDNSSTSKQ
ncbi:hypothetical protein QAD02_003852, partial [Eretmocerus hayati]